VARFFDLLKDSDCNIPISKTNASIIKKYSFFSEILQKKLHKKKMSCFLAYGQVSQQNHIFNEQRNIAKKYFSMHFGFHNQFIKAMRTRSIFPKKYFVFF